MDNTELHYLTYDPDAIWDQMIINYVDAGGDILYPGDEKEMLLRSVLADIVQIFAGVDNALRMQTLRYAVGPYLDMIGELRGCERIEASPAKTTVTITANATGRTGTLEAGTSMTADGQVFYMLTEDLELTGYEQTATVEIECMEDGSEGTVEGASIGGGNIRVDYVNGMYVDFTGENNTILVLHWDKPGVIADVTSLMRLKYPSANISNFHLSRKERGGEALMTIELDTGRGQTANESEMANDIRGLSNVINAIVIRAI